MRRVTKIEHLYLDFDGFFASVEQQCKPHLRDRPVGVIPFDVGDPLVTSMIAASKEAKAYGVKNVMTSREALALCPDLIFTCQNPDLYRRAHNALIAEINSVIPIDAIKSIDEITCRVMGRDCDDPENLARRIKTAIRTGVGAYITCSIGFAATRQLAKMACKVNKPDGVTIWHPDDMPGPLLCQPLADVPGIGRRMLRRLACFDIYTTEALLALSPKHMRKIWRGVTGERLWYALNGYDVVAQPAERIMFGHGRVLPPECRTLGYARDCARLLLTKASRRLRREQYYTGYLSIWLHLRDRITREQASFSRGLSLPVVNDEPAILEGLQHLWVQIEQCVDPHADIIRLGVTLSELSPANERQLDLLHNDDPIRQKFEKLTAAIDELNQRYSKTIVSLGSWTPPKGGYAGGKISYTRIPSAEDFY